MAQRRFHYDLAFEHYLRERAIPYVAVDEAKRAIGRSTDPLPVGSKSAGRPDTPTSLKSFDFVVYSRSGVNLLIDVKGRKHSRRHGNQSRSLDNWVTEADVQCLEQWETIFGHQFKAAFAFLYWCEAPPPDALFIEAFESTKRWYAILAIGLDEYRQHMKPRSSRWRTVCMPSRSFMKLARPIREML